MTLRQLELLRALNRHRTTVAATQDRDADDRTRRLGDAVRARFEQAQVAYAPAVEVRYCNTACGLAAAGVDAAVMDPFSPHQAVGKLEVRRFAPAT